MQLQSLLSQRLSDGCRTPHSVESYGWGGPDLNLHLEHREAQHYFCKVCGIYTHHVMRGETETIGLNMACIDGFDIFALSAVPVGNGKDEWSVVLGGGAA